MCEESNGQQGNEDSIWLKQTINNACGLYAILHAIFNSKARDMLRPASLAKTLFEACSSLPADERPLVLENSAELENLYAQVAMQGTSSVPDNPEDEVDWHYVCFAKSQASGRLYELDGDRKGPLDRGLLGPDDDALALGGLRVIREYVRHERESNDFSLMALVSQE
ncbi:Peptidase C12, ubiquitin carboxyl-terminal hydrolase 1 [Niveomyces insectorum RCEF 264]|uniref:Ubiquitin carboxyl-terminal hydrolase n=1 Tax=Niveomyces insectorum RCEF 264 TaxID=1081102 RepID=A0A167QTR2_9HYPO|nr:Peptidase C12, ubiquitin carboxyl-terminal hydrolase 1 [Niveomyces insectorum RCEF 264]